LNPTTAPLRTRRTTPAVPIAVGVTVALLLVAGWTIPIHPTPTPTPSFAPSLTLYEALAIANTSVPTASGSSWYLNSFVGVDYQQSWASVPTFYAAACQDFVGPSLWNPTGLPASGAPLASGAAPVWFFLFLNNSDDGLFVTVTNGTAYVIGPLSSTSPCGAAVPFAGLAQGFGRVSPFPPDTTAVAPRAWSAVGSSFTAAHTGSLVLYADGVDLLDLSDASGYLSVGYGQCGTPGFIGTSPFTWYNTGFPTIPLNGSVTCGQTNFEASGPAVMEGLVGNDSGLAVTLAYLNTTFPGLPGGQFNDSWGLTAGMATLQLLNATSTTPYGLLTVRCTTGTLSVAACRQTGTGWFAVLTAPNGRWLDVYSSADANGSWLFPNVPIFQGDGFLLLSTSVSELASGVLSMESNATHVTVSGTFHVTPPSS
jgi:hypothetical protein